MNEFGLNDDDFSDKEILTYIDEVDLEYENWNVNLDKMVSNLTDTNKIFLSDLNNKVGDKIFYIIYGYLNAENLIDYDELTVGGMSEFIDGLDNEDTLNFIELLIGFKKQDIELVEDEADFKIIIKKLKRDVATLKKKMAQPQIYINTAQFEEMFGLSQAQQKGLRGKIHDPLPSTVTNGKTILYEADLVKKWLENYRRKH